METVEAIVGLAGLALEIVLIVKLFICFKQIKDLTIENANIRKYLNNIYLKQDKEFKEQSDKINEVLERINKYT